jgi:chemotaxis methyl-accepting protein methylase
VTRALEQVAAVVYAESGIRLGEPQHAFLQAALDRIGAGDAESFLGAAANPGRGPQLVAKLIEEVTVKETSFLRDREQLGRIDWVSLLERARARGAERVRVWTAACATGEEPYSLALLASEAFAPAPAPVSILATDISTTALARAREGRYGARSVRELDAALRARYLQEVSGRLVVGEQLRALVTFARHNLIRDPFPPLGEAPFDLILCRNVLIYFDAATVGRVLESFEQARAATGTLVLGAADVLCASASRIATAAAPGPAAELRPRRALRRPLGRSPAPAPAADDHDAAAYFQRGLEALEDGDPAAAVGSLRRALYVEPHFGLAAFKLGGAHEALGERPAARRAYRQALRALEPHARHEPFLGQIDLADVATAAQRRLDALEPGAAGAAPGSAWRPTAASRP